ncbi:MAG: hypothetical protein ACO1RT_06805 [Planctomycetaceae bacterium]
MGSTNLLTLTRRLSAFFVVGLLAVTTHGGGHAGAQDAFDTVIEVRGKLKDVRRNILTVTRDDGTDVSVMLHEDPTKLVFAAEAKPQWLKPGMLVRVESMFGPSGAPPMPLDTVEIFQPFQASRSVSVAQREMYLPGIHSLEPKHAQAAGPAQGFQPGKYRVVGTLVGGGPSGIIINTGQMQVPVPVAADAKWLIRFHNLSLAQPGDLVHVTGFHQPPDETQVKAGSVRISVDRIYGEVTENPRARKRTRGKPDEPEAAAPAEAAADAAPAETAPANGKAPEE